jgi:hypothetical protein
MAARYPDFFIVGAPKCGTTSAADYLKQYPGVFMPALKEPRFYASDPFSQAIFGLQRVASREAYLRLFAPAPPGALLGEATPYYLISPTAIAEARADSPDAKFIAFIRNPVDLAFALHWQLVMLFLEEERDFARAWRGQIRGFRLGQRGSKPYRMLVSLGSHLRRFFRQVEPEKRLVLVLDDFRTDVVAATRRLTDFLGVPHDPKVPWPHSNPRQTYVSWPLARLVLEHRPALARFQPDVTRVLLEADHPLGRLLVRRAPPEAMDPELRREIVEELRPEIERIGELLDRDVSDWLR